MNTSTCKELIWNIFIEQLSKDCGKKNYFLTCPKIGQYWLPKYGTIHQDFLCLIFTCVFELFLSAIFDTDICSRVCYQTVCGPYPRRTYGFAFPALFSNFVGRFLFVLLHLKLSMDWMSARKSFHVNPVHCYVNFIQKLKFKVGFGFCIIRC